MFLFMMAIDTPEDKSKFEKLYGKYKEIMYYAVVLRLRYSSGYSDEEIAEILGITKENVRTRAKRGKQKLGKMLQERGIWY